MIDSITFLRDLVAIPSLSGEETAVARFLVSQMAALGMDSFVDAAGNAVGIRACPDADGRFCHEIVLLGHMDTVPGAIAVRLENGRLYGRGSVDAKGPLATFVLAAAQAELAPGTRLVVIGAVEEESATSKGARHMATQYQPDLCIIGEPSGADGVTLGYKGRLLIDYDLALPMSHTAGAELGAAETAVAFWNQLSAHIAAFNADKTRLFEQLLPSLRHVCTSSDGIHNSVALKVGIRLPPAFDVGAFQQEVEEMGGTAVLRFYAHEPAYQSTRRTPLAQRFNRIMRQAGITPRFKLKTGTSDMNVVGPVWQCPIVAYGPGDSNLDHTPDEHVVIEEYLQAIEVLRQVLSEPW